MIEKVQFATLLAQVIPVAILAVVLESRSGHEARAQAPTGVSPPSWSLVLEALFMTFIVFVEVAALMTAAGSDNRCLNWFAGRPGAIGVGVLLVQVVALYAVNLANAYQSSGKLCPEQARDVKIVARTLLGGSIVLALVVVIFFV
ncbi:hypothetical protein [Streptomyces chryseus]|uniref:hypothetical protein n=1 Tax=Streptomyces chryseus TaxID=68186 RepID=UPI00110FC41B|nr:hypothetical protein [Streptomyces chryseus]